AGVAALGAGERRTLGHPALTADHLAEPHELGGERLPLVGQLVVRLGERAGHALLAGRREPELEVAVRCGAERPEESLELRPLDLDRPVRARGVARPGA